MRLETASGTTSAGDVGRRGAQAQHDPFSASGHLPAHLSATGPGQAGRSGRELAQSRATAGCNVAWRSGWTRDIPQV